MVQHTSLGNLLNDVNEFQVVHALITQSLKGKQPEQESPDQSDMETVNSQNNIITAMCQNFNTLNPSHHKRVFPKLVKELITHVRKSQERCVAMSSGSRSSSHGDKHVPPRKQSCVVRYASVLKATKKEDGDKTGGRVLNTDALSPSARRYVSPNSLLLRRSMQKLRSTIQKTVTSSTSSVHDKVLQFEKQAGIVRPTVSEASCASCRETPKQPNECPTSSDLPCSDECKVKQDESENPSSMVKPPLPPPVLEPARKEGRSLKRVPSERFQKMRRKVQRLMSRRSSDVTDIAPVVNSIDETTFLQSIRIPDPGLARSDSQDCLFLRMPDHVLRRVFSLLDTRTLAAVKSTCSDFNFIVNHFDIRATDSRWTKDHRYLGDPCIQCRHMFVRGDMSMCRFHPKRYYSDLPYGRSYWMCCLQYSRSAPGCRTGVHDNHWLRT